ncbi:BQ5605_C015g08002 [Microbotryum silenes-dioicae]|uniref:BQ5605_C015g08002 protein n=1 Tax=Microbotryum silenes-dioicae TaxID=796604 RepID=A0A2X0MEZ6_9BASI|nr:BQ5605_C015g08002 [Microbotryum silenes-dioicae]
MAPNAIALAMQQNLDAEAEADRFLQEQDEQDERSLGTIEGGGGGGEGGGGPNSAGGGGTGGAGGEGLKLSSKPLETRLVMQNSGENDDDDDEAFRRELDELEREESMMPSSAVATPAVRRMHPAPVIAVWIFLSSSVILFNARILGKKEGDFNFPYPIFLTTVHLLWATIGTRVLARFTHLLDGLQNINMTWDQYTRNILPIGALFSASLIFSNLAYLTLSVSFIQMLKAFTAVAVLTMSVMMGLEQFSRRTTIVVCFISMGVFIASYHEANFIFAGFIFQSLGILFEATRLVAIQKLLQGLRMDPLVSLYYFAPVCAGLNLFLVPIFEGYRPFELILKRVGGFTLFINCNFALLLNISVVYLIGCASSLVLTLSGVLKDVLLVTGSVVLYRSPISFAQMLGYSIALGGLVVFKTPPEVMAGYIARVKAIVGR